MKGDGKTKTPTKFGGIESVFWGDLVFNTCYWAVWRMMLMRVVTSVTLRMPSPSKS